MLRQFCINQLNRPEKVLDRGKKKSITLLFFFLFYSLFLEGIEAPKLGGLEKLQKINKTLEKDLQIKFKNSVRILSENKINSDFTAFILDDDFLTDILISSEEVYLEATSRNFCSFLFGLKANLLKSSYIKGTKEDLVLVRGYKGDKSTGLYKISKDAYINFWKKRKCPQLSFDNSKSGTNKRSLEIKRKFKNIKNIKQCLFETREIQKSNDFFSYCHLYEKIKNNIKKRREIFSDFEWEFLSHICQKESEYKKSCQTIYQEDFWRVLAKSKKEEDKALIYEFCGEEETQTCLKKIHDSKNSCHDLSTQSIIIKRPNCDELKEGISKSKLLKLNFDCPRKIENLAIVNFNRMTKFKASQEIREKFSKENCAERSIVNYFDLLMDGDHEDLWGMKVCYFHPLKEEEDCSPFYPGNNYEHVKSETRVITDVSRNALGLIDKNRCYLTPRKDYNVAMLSYRNGCHLLYDVKNCTSMSCEKEIMIEGKKISNIKYKNNGGIISYYFPISYENKHKSISMLLEKKYKLQNRRINNVIIAKTFLSKGKSKIVHGVGCLESILPRFKKRLFFNSCTPVPFLIGGVLLKGETYMAIVHLSIDGVNTTRILPWSQIDQSIKSYKLVHPLSSWMLYGL